MPGSPRERKRKKKTHYADAGIFESTISRVLQEKKKKCLIAVGGLWPAQPISHMVGFGIK